jgi:hypothetical protein
LQVEVLGTIGDVERQRGRFAESHAALEQAADIAHERLGAGDARTLNAELLLIRLDLVQSKYASASNRLNRAVAAFRASNQGDSEVLSEAIEDQARLRMALGDDAVALASDALTMARRLPRAEGEDQISHALQTFGDALTRAGRPAEAIAPLDEARAYISSKVGNQHAFVAMVHRLTATAEAELGHLDRADELSQQAVAIYRQVYKRPFANFALALNERADILLRLARWDDGIALGEEALAMQRKLFTDAHASIASTLTILGSARYRQQRYADAESLQREALAIALQTLGAEHPTVARIQRELGLTLAALGRHDEAAQLVALATASDHKRFGDSHVQIANDLLIAAELAVARGESNSAATKASTAVAMFERELPPHSSKLLTARLDAGRVLLAAHDFAQAEPMFDAAVADARTGTPVVALYLAQAFAGLGDAQAGQDHVDSARASWQTALETLARAPEADATLAEKLARQLKTSSR